MISRSIRGLRHTVHLSRNRLRQRGLILHYHRIAEPHSDPWFSAVTSRHFAEHLEILREYAHPIGLQELSQGLLDGNLPDRSVVVTFDDGYADNFYNAKPLLEHYDVPATFFLTTGYVGHEHEFWWDELERLLLQPGTLPNILHLSVNGSTRRWQLGKATHYSEKASRRRWSAWNDVFSPRRRLYRSLWELLYLMPKERQNVLDELRVWAGMDSAARPNYLPLSLEETLALAKVDLVEVGAHTVTHPALSTLSSASQRYEILGSKARLEEILGKRVNSFAYPHGSMSADTVAIVREAGFACACSTFADVVGRSADRFRLPRVEVKDQDKQKLGKLLRWFLN